MTREERTLALIYRLAKRLVHLGQTAEDRANELEATDLCFDAVRNPTQESTPE